MVYQLKPDPRRETPTRRLPGVRELEAQKRIRISRDEPPPALGTRTRTMGLLMAVLGLATFFVPLINTSIPVLGTTEWSPMQVLNALLEGALPAHLQGSPSSTPVLYKVILLDSILFGAMFAYIALLVILYELLRSRTRLVIGFAAGLGLVASLLEMRGYDDLQLSLFGGAPAQVGGGQVMGFTWALVLFVVFILIVAIATIKDLEGVPSFTGPQ